MPEEPATDFERTLRTHLDGFTTAPFLFVGSGFSRRYAGTPDWVGLLRELAGHTGKPYERYAATASNELPRIASLIAADFNDVWWESDDFTASRIEHPAPATPYSPLKIEVAHRFADVTAAMPIEGPLNDELEALRGAVVEGIITTNYDTILEYVFNDFTVYVGQDELLFKDPHGVAEIYKIHGSASSPETLVLTAEDYARFDERNPYLAAKLLSMFVEHPILFLGYSMTDENVQAIVTSIASVLSKDNLDQLADRLIFVNWNPDATESLSAGTFDVGGGVIPVRYATVPDYLGVFRVLGGLRRRFPARILRHLRESVYELARTSEPSGTVKVADLASDTEIRDLDVVVGVGVQKRLGDAERLNAKGLTGLTRKEILLDVLEPRLSTQLHGDIVRTVLPVVAPGRAFLPVFRYLRGAGLLDPDGAVSADADVPAPVRAKARLGLGPLRSSKYFDQRARRIIAANTTLTELIDNQRRSDVLLAIPYLDTATLDLEALRAYLRDNQDAFDGAAVDATRWSKAVCFYDNLASRSLTNVSSG